MEKTLYNCMFLIERKTFLVYDDLNFKQFQPMNCVLYFASLGISSDYCQLLYYSISFKYTIFNTSPICKIMILVSHQRRCVDQIHRTFMRMNMKKKNIKFFGELQNIFLSKSKCLQVNHHSSPLELVCLSRSPYVSEKENLKCMLH